VLRDPNATELRAVAPLIAVADRRLLGPITLVFNGRRVIGVTSAEVLRTSSSLELAVATKLDGSATIPIGNWNVGRYSGVGLVDIEEPIPAGHDVVALSIGSVHASVDVHGATSAIVTIEQQGDRYERSLVPVHIDADDAGGMSDNILYVVSPLHPAHVGAPIGGATAFAWLPPEPALGRRTFEVVAFGLANPYTAGVAKPRNTPVIAELASLEDLGRALIVPVEEGGTEKELKEVTGEIAGDADDPLDGLE